MGVKGKVISLINMKGGVGKTTLCREIALYISTYFKKEAEDGTEVPIRVLLIDVDPQANLTQSLLEKYSKDTKFYTENEAGEKVLEYKCSVDNIFKEDMVGADRKRVILNLTNNLDLMPGELETIFIQRQNNPSTPNKLMDYILEEDLRGEYDFIFLDCPPTYSVYTEMSFYASDYYFVPAVPDAYSVLGVDLLEKVVKDIVKAQRNGVFKERQPRNLGVIWTGVNLTRKPRQADYIEGLKDSDIVMENKIHIFKSFFGESNKLATAPFEKSIVDRQDKALDDTINNICNELMDRIEEMNNEDPVEKDSITGVKL
ncbi:ParA family protein [Bacillus pumilus]|uniref:ParA family protein n=1 Tax=Bacillus pumilus TaxID=1408 RepID=UPI00017A678E|nr:ParA family protein [Bacillus pumilus]EDW21373.1 chromosome partitioning ATPase [Bacillus pumilus ATCC 7061]MCR4355441.1 ParA family protein [Bacillus pumilus]MCY7505455.1 ParA family protein [Bacillus pumilus]MDR4268100.1 ParA family protein [Bacillus pumilus]MED4630987.1 ParA family protein [Bacillus pumilus]